MRRWARTASYARRRDDAEAVGDAIGRLAGRASLPELLTRGLREHVVVGDDRARVARPRSRSRTRHAAACSVKWSIAPPGVPRHISSCIFVSSRATATFRAGSTRLGEVAEGRDHSVGRLEDDDRARLATDRLEPLRRARCPCAAGSPRTRTGRSASPESTSALSTALGPGTTSTSSPASMQTRTSRRTRIRDARHPRVGDDRDRGARRISSTSSPARRRSLCSWTATEPPAGGHAERASAAHVCGGCPRPRSRRRRAAPRPPAARGRRGCRSACATRTSLPVSHDRRHDRPAPSTISTTSPGREAPSVRRPRTAPRSRSGHAPPGARRDRAASSRSAGPARRPRTRRRRSGTASRSCGPAGTVGARAHRRRRHARAARVDAPLASTRSRPLRAPRRLRARATPSPTPRHTLNRISSTSPSRDDVVLPLDPQLPGVLRLRPRADVEQLLPDDHLGADEPTLQVGVDHARALGRRRRRPGTSRRATPCHPS